MEKAEERAALAAARPSTPRTDRGREQATSSANKAPSRASSRPRKGRDITPPPHVFDPGYGRASWASESEEAEAAKHPAGRQGWLLSSRLSRRRRDRSLLSAPRICCSTASGRWPPRIGRRSWTAPIRMDGRSYVLSRRPSERPPLGGGSSSSTGIHAICKGAASKFPPIPGSSTPATGSDRGAGAWTREVSQRRKDRRPPKNFVDRTFVDDEGRVDKTWRKYPTSELPIGHKRGANAKGYGKGVHMQRTNPLFGGGAHASDT